MSKYDDIIEVVGYAVMNIQGYGHEDYDHPTMEASRRLYDSAIKAEIVRRVDAFVAKEIKRHTKAGLVVTNKAEWRGNLIAKLAEDYKSFDEWRAGF